MKTHLLQLIKSKERFYQTYFNSLDLEINATGGNKKILADVIHIINENLSKEDLCVQDIADELALSRSKLYRKIKELTGKSANEMIRKMRVGKVKRTFRNNSRDDHWRNMLQGLVFHHHPIIPKDLKNIQG